MLGKHIWTFLTGIICFYIQILVMPAFELFGVIPNIFIPWIVYLVWTREIKPVLIIGFIIGLLYDTTLPESFGLYALLIVLTAIALDQFRKPFESESVVAKLLSLLLADIIFHLIGFLVLGVAYGFGGELFRLTSIAFGYNLAVGFLVFWVMQMASRLRIVLKHD
jgi:rod shape-determining protein MreD